MGKGQMAALIIMAVVVSALFVTFVYNPFAIPGDGPGDDGDAESSKFSFTLYKEDTATAVSSMTVTTWYDTNGDGKMQSNELKLCSDSSGTYTSGKEYPIGLDYDIWVQGYGSGYQTVYEKVHMTGSRNSDGSAKDVEEDVFIRATDDSVTYDGTINGVGWDDSTDYNATLSGTSGEAEVKIVLSAADKGLSSNLWDDVNYKSIYSDLINGLGDDIDLSDYPQEFWIKWDSVISGLSESSIMAPDFFGIYMTVGDKVDLSPTVAHFDLYGDDNTNWYGAMVVSSSWGDLMYNTGDSSAPRPSVTFDVGTITGTGTTTATYGVAIHTGLTYEEFTSFKWTASAAYYLGTPGDDWDWTVV